MQNLPLTFYRRGVYKFSALELTFQRSKNLTVFKKKSKFN